MNKSIISLLRLSFTVITLGLIVSACTSDNNRPDNVSDNGLSNLSLPLPEGMTRAEGEPGLQPPVIPPLNPLEPPISGTAVVEAIYDNIKGVIINQKRVFNAGFAFDQMSIFNPSSNQIYPGSVFIGSSITNGKFLNLKSTVGNIIWSANGLYPLNPSDTFIRTVVDPKSSDFNSTLQNWYTIPTQPLAATTTYEVNEVSSAQEIGTQIGIGYDSDDIKAKLNLTGKHKNMKTHVLVKAVQKAYSISLDVPNAQTCILTSADVNDMDGVMPVYVSEVFFGRVGYAVISSNHEYHEVVAALSLNVPIKENNQVIDIDISAEYKKILDSSVGKTYIIGGTSAEHGLGLSNGWQGFKEALSTPLTPSSAKPIAYTLRYVNDNSVARVVLTSDYVLNESYFIPEADELIIKMQPASVRAKAGARKPLCLFGHVKVKLDQPNENWQYLFNKPINSYVRLEDGNTPAYLRDETATELVIKRPANMSMKELLNQKVLIEAEFGNADPTGRAKLDDLGSTKSQCTVQDIIFGALRGSMNFYTQRNYPGEYEANIIFEPVLDTKGAKRLDNRYGY